MSVHRDGAFYMPTTPFTDRPEQKIDREAFFKQIRRAAEGGARSIICGAASGEAYDLKPEDMVELVTVAREAAGELPVNVYGSAPWETPSAVEACAKMMEAGAAGVMELPPTYAYVSNPGVEKRYRETSAACGGQLIVYAKGDAGSIPSDAVIAKLAGEGLICAVKRACDSVPFEMTAKAVRAANPKVLVIQGAAERFVPGVIGCADGYTTGTGVVFPRISKMIEQRFFAQNPTEIRQAVDYFSPVELMRAEHVTGYNIAPLKWLLMKFYGIGNAQTRGRFMELLPADEARLAKIAEPLAEMESTMP